MIVGNARVSTSEQNLDLQLNALKRPECEKIIEDTVSGGKPSRETPDVPRPKCDH
jgi:DNA invertase Pin-like site-specific DNA recombinase